MKITKTESPAPFLPVTVNILCETQDELDAIATILDVGVIDDAVGRVWPALRSNVNAHGSFLPCSPRLSPQPKCTELTEALRVMLTSK